MNGLAIGPRVREPHANTHLVAEWIQFRRFGIILQLSPMQASHQEFFLFTTAVASALQA